MAPESKGAVAQRFVNLFMSTLRAPRIMEHQMPLPRRVVDALPERDRDELICWATMAGMKPEEYLEACIKKGHQILGQRVIDTPTYLQEPESSARKAG